MTIPKSDLVYKGEELDNFRDLGGAGEGYDRLVTYICPCGKGTVVQVFYLDKHPALPIIHCEECAKQYIPNLDLSLTEKE